MKRRMRGAADLDLVKRKVTAKRVRGHLKRDLVPILFCIGVSPDAREVICDAMQYG
jgi:hypothetical protein